MNSTAANITKRLRTEDTGKMFEQAICLAFGTPQDGPQKQDTEKPRALQPRLKKLTELFPPCTHTAKRGARYDQTAIGDSSYHLSAKTTKKGVGKVAPQVVGQCQPSKFCEVLGIPQTNAADLKAQIQANIATILPVLAEQTFDCPNLYYNEERDTIQQITLTKPIHYSALRFTWTCPAESWGNSSTVKVNHGGREIALMEFQFHTKSRTNMAIRWCQDNFLTLFADHLKIVNL